MPPQPAESAELAAANAAFGRGDHDSALEQYTQLAQAGDAEAQFKLAAMYQAGTGVTPDESWAVTWYRRAAVQGHAEANQRLVAIYTAAGIEPPEIKVAAVEEIPAETYIAAAEPAEEAFEVADEPVATASEEIAEDAGMAADTVSASIKFHNVQIHPKY